MTTEVLEEVRYEVHQLRKDVSKIQDDCKDRQKVLGMQTESISSTFKLIGTLQENMEYMRSRLDKHSDDSKQLTGDLLKVNTDLRDSIAKQIKESEDRSMTAIRTAMRTHKAVEHGICNSAENQNSEQHGNLIKRGLVWFFNIRNLSVVVTAIVIGAAAIFEHMTKAL